MKRTLFAAAAAFLLGVWGVALAGYADDRAEIENLSNVGGCTAANVVFH